MVKPESTLRPAPNIPGSGAVRLTNNEVVDLVTHHFGEREELEAGGRWIHRAWNPGDPLDSWSYAPSRSTIADHTGSAARESEIEAAALAGRPVDFDRAAGVAVLRQVEVHSTSAGPVLHPTGNYTVYVAQGRDVVIYELHGAGQQITEEGGLTMLAHVDREGINVSVSAEVMPNLVDFLGPSPTGPAGAGGAGAATAVTELRAATTGVSGAVEAAETLEAVAGARFVRAMTGHVASVVVTELAFRAAMAVEEEHQRAIQHQVVTSVEQRLGSIDDAQVQSVSTYGTAEPRPVWAEFRVSVADPSRTPTPTAGTVMTAPYVLDVSPVHYSTEANADDRAHRRLTSEVDATGHSTFVVRLPVNNLALAAEQHPEAPDAGTGDDATALQPADGTAALFPDANYNPPGGHAVNVNSDGSPASHEGVVVTNASYDPSQAGGYCGAGGHEYRSADGTQLDSRDPNAREHNVSDYDPSHQPAAVTDPAVSGGTTAPTSSHNDPNNRDDDVPSYDPSHGGF